MRAPNDELRPLLQRLMSSTGRGARLRLHGVRIALARLGSPERGLPVLHVAGTNGKGSVCAMLEAMARSAGLRTGLYTSPHLCRFNERIRIAGSPIDDETLAAALTAAMAPELPSLTFFETMTVAAFWAFRSARVDVAILEVGLGGRLDATNVVEAPLCTAITSIALDHTTLLGDDLASIGAEKAGIAKPDTPLVVGPVAPRAWRAIQRVARRVGAGPLWRVETGKTLTERPPRGAHRILVRRNPSGHVTIEGPRGDTVTAGINLRGPHQAENAAVAVGVSWALSDRWPALAAGASQALRRVRWAGRLERLQVESVQVILDGAHNAAAAAALAEELRGQIDPCRTSLVFGAMSDKPWQPMLAILAPLASRRYYTEPLRPIAGRRAADPRDLAQVAPGSWLGEPRVTIRHAIAHALRGETIVVAGSIFLVGAVRAALLGLQEDTVLPL